MKLRQALWNKRVELRHSPIPLATRWCGMPTEVLYVVGRIESEVAVLDDEDQRSVDAPVGRFQLLLHEGLTFARAHRR